VLAVDGISDFNALHFGKRNDEVQPCAFDILAGGGNKRPRGPNPLLPTSATKSANKRHLLPLIDQLVVASNVKL